MSGGGEAGVLLRSVDWSRTAVGSPETWSQALRSAVAMLLHSDWPMLLWWGPKFVQFYNAPYRPVLGDKHPRAMGQSIEECWPEIVDIIGPMAERPFLGGPATWSDDALLLIDRKIKREECHFRLAYSPVPDETVPPKNGPVGIGGVLAVVTETTEQVYAERQIRLLRDLGGRSLKEAQTAEQACVTAARTLGENRADLPFSLLYLFDERGEHPRLVASTGFGSADLADVDGRFPLERVARERRIETIDDLAPVLPNPPLSPWGDPPKSAIMLPLASPDQEHAYGVFVCGVSPHRVLDEGYRTFFDLVTSQVVTAIRNALAFETAKRRAEQLAELDRAKTAFFSNVSHEFRTPLTLMLGPIIDSLEDVQHPLPPAQRERQERVLRNGQRLQKLVNTLLDFARIEAGRVQARFQPTDLCAATRDLASAFRSLVEKAGLTLEVDCPQSMEPVFVDRQMFEKIVLNLLSNAFKFTFEGSIRVSLRTEGDEVLLSVSDTGTGIEAAELPRLFERFHRVEGAKGRSFEGSGIGLALVQELAKLHGGQIHVESQVGKGSTFTVSLRRGSAHLPKEQLEAPAPSAPLGTHIAPFVNEAAQWVGGEPAPRAEEEERAPAVGRILLADDNADMREYVRQLLLSQGWEVEAVSDGQAALEKALARPPDLVLTDVMMPKLDGFGLLRALRSDERTKVTPVVVLSARAGEEAQVEGLDAGADDYLVKPFAARELLARVRSHVHAHRTRREATRVVEAAKALAESDRARFQELLSRVPAMINFLRGPELVWEFVHPGTLKRLGGRKLIGLPLLESMPEHRDQPFLAMLQKVLRTGEPAEGREVMFRLANPETGAVEETYWNFMYLPVRNAAGAIDGVMTFDIDVTTAVTARRKAEALSEELKLADQRKDEFLAMLAHELRNPMAAISMALSVMERSPNDAPKLARNRETARRQMGNLVRLVDDLLDVSRITRGRVELRKEPVDLAAVVQSAISATRPDIEGRGHELSVTFTPGAYDLVADATRLEQVVVNLLTNAAKYTEPNGRISVRLSQENGGAVISVKDSGRGIPAAMLDRVFDVFVQVDPSIDRSTGGLGLGLTLVKRLVEMHGGAVSVKSDGVGKGSEFTVQLPLPARPGAAPQAASNLIAATNGDRRRILLVEDAPDVRESLKEFLEDLGHEVETATNGSDGAEKLLRLRPDVALVDVGLPGMDGYEVAKKVRAAPGGSGLYLVALTGYGGAEAKERATRAGFDLHLTKPVDIDELPDVIGRARR